MSASTQQSERPLSIRPCLGSYQLLVSLLFCISLPACAESNEAVYPEEWYTYNSVKVGDGDDSGPHCPVAESNFREPDKLTLVVGVGFKPDELAIFKVAARRWAERTGLKILVTDSHGLKGNVHMFDEFDACGEGEGRAGDSMAEATLGCYQVQTDRIAYSRPGIMAFTERLVHDAGDAALSTPQQYRQVLFFVFLHEIGHWLGLGHRRSGEQSVMVPTPLQAFLGSSSLHKHVWNSDVIDACRANICPDDWCHFEKNTEH